MAFVRIQILKMVLFSFSMLYWLEVMHRLEVSLSILPVMTLVFLSLSTTLLTVFLLLDNDILNWCLFVFALCKKHLIKFCTEIKRIFFLISKRLETYSNTIRSTTYTISVQREFKTAWTISRLFHYNVFFRKC